ncbi:hypothetical protein D3C80_1712810 [compost metagenome]
MENQAVEFYTSLFGGSLETAQKYVSDYFSQKKLISDQNDFSVEILMAYKEETPLCFLELNSSWMVNQKLPAVKPVCINHIIHQNGEGLRELINRAEQVALQRKLDLIWIRVFNTDQVLLDLMPELGYLEFEFDIAPVQGLAAAQIYFSKIITN